MSKNELRSSEKRRRRDFANGAGGIPWAEFSCKHGILPTGCHEGSATKMQSFLFISKYSKIN